MSKSLRHSLRQAIPRYFRVSVQRDFIEKIIQMPVGVGDALFYSVFINSHTLFALEDIYGFKINKIDGEICISLDKNRGATYISLDENFTAWYNEAEKYRNGEITKDDYDKWRYNYPKFDIDSGFVKLPSKDLSDAIVDAFKNKID